MRLIILIYLLVNLLSNISLASNVSSTTPSLTPITLQLLWKHQFEFAGFYAAKSQGYYKDVGLDVTFRELEQGEKPSDEVISGRADYGILDSSLIVERSKGSPIVLLSNILQHSPLVLLTKNDSGITSPAQMIGKTIMLGSNELSNASIIAMLNKENVTIDQLNVIPLTFNVDDLIKDKTDIISAYASNQPGVLKQQKIPFNIISPINYGIDFYGNNIFTSEYELINFPERTKDFVNASLKGWKYALDNPDEIIELILNKYSQHKTKESLQFEAKTLRDYILPEHIPLGTIDEARLKSNIDIYKTLGLVQLPFTVDDLLAKNLNFDSENLTFTNEEINWLQQKKNIILGVDPAWKPFEFIDDNNNLAGMSADFIKIISEKTGLKITIQDNDTWADVIESAKNKSLDVLPAVMKSPQREEYLEFTTPHINYPMVIVTTKDKPYVAQLSDLKEQEVIVVKGYVTEDLLKINHKSLNIKTANTITEALNSVASGDSYAFVDNLATITTAITEGGFSNLRINGTTQYQFKLGMAVPKNNTMLLNILQKTIDSISIEEKNKIKNKWIDLQYKQVVDYTIVYQIIVIAAVILVFIIIWNRRLSNEITFRKIAEQKALESEKRFRMLFEDNKAVELIIDPTNKIIVKGNNAATDFYGYSHEELTDMPLNQINILSNEDIKNEMANAKAQKRSHFYFKHKLANGDIRDVEVHSGPVEWDNQTLLYSIIHDVTTEKELQTELAQKAIELEFQASHDALTGLVNRREFEQRLEKILTSCSENDYCACSVLALDLDNFKVVNDTAGHAIGDEVLLQISQIMNSKVRNRDTFARLGGDEFGVLLNNCSIKDAEEVAISIIEAVKGFNYQWHDSTFHLGVSIGITSVDNDNISMDDTLNRADAACYEAKRLGRNRLQVYSEDNLELSRRQGERWWTNEIVSAIEENRFSLFHQKIQPIADHNSHEGEQFEVLIRLNDSEGNLVFPDNFIPAAERYHLMPSIDLWVIENTFAYIATLKEDQLHKCSINLSGQSFARDDFYDDIMQKFKTHNIPAHKICWEITETAAIADFDKAKSFISKLHNFGCLFSLDDFGSGLSSFSYLKHLEIDYIKIDGSFVKEILTEPKDQLIVESIQNLGQSFGIKTIAEFVENDDIKQRLIELNIDYAQGYGIHKPSPLQ